jgi:DNA polymerase III subunit delta'
MSEASSAYPWHESQWVTVEKQLQTGRRPHAMLLTGPADSGKREFADSLARRLLCREPVLVDKVIQACRHCPACHLLNAGTHPDLVFVRPEDSKLIKVDQIRALNHWVSQTSGQGGDKVAIIYPAEQMNGQSANALLKCLEEPTPGTLFILVADQPAKILPTVRSRCQVMAFTIPDNGVAIGWLNTNIPPAVDVHRALALAGGLPLKAIREIDAEYLARRNELLQVFERLLKGAEPALEAARAVQKHPPREVLVSMLSLVEDAIRSHMSSRQELRNSDSLELLQLFNQVLGADRLFELADSVKQSIRDLESASNPNAQLLLEVLFISCTSEGNSGARQINSL